MEVILDITREEALKLKEARLAQGAIEISASALIVAYHHANSEKNKAIDNQDFEYAVSWRDNEQNILHGIADLGLAPVDSELPKAELALKK